MRRPERQRKEYRTWQQCENRCIAAGSRLSYTLQDGQKGNPGYGETDPGVAPGTPGFFGLAPSMVTVSLDDPGANAAERVTVQVHDYPLFLFTPGIARTYIARPITQTMTIESMGVTP